MVNGSPTQTAMAALAGARTQVAQLVFAGVVVIVLLFLTRPLQYLPRCVLGGIVFTIAIGLIDLRNLRHIRRESPGEFTLAVITAAVVALWGAPGRHPAGDGVSLPRHVSHSHRPHTMVLVPDPTGRWMPASAVPGCETEPGRIVYRFGADLFYANEYRFADEVQALVERAPTAVQWFVVDAGAITDLDYAAARSVLGLLEQLKGPGVNLIFARVSRYRALRHGPAWHYRSDRGSPNLHDASRSPRHSARRHACVPAR